MIGWQDEGIVLTTRPHGETAVILDLFTRHHGRHAGLVRGGISRRLRPVLQPGAQVAAQWSARVEDQLGAYVVEPLRARAAALDQRLTVAGLSAVTALLTLALPDRDPHPGFHDRTSALLDLCERPDLWPLAYLRWEKALLDEMGFGLDFTSCAVTGARTGLAYVSPRSGRAVSREGAGKWADRLLPLAPALLGEGGASGPEIAAALATTGWFLEHRLLATTAPNRPLPAARARLITEIAQAG